MLAPLTVILLVLTLNVRVVTTENHGVQIRLTEMGINEIARVAVDLYDDNIENAPPMSTSSQSAQLNVSFTGLRVGPDNFQKPVSRVQISSSLGIVWMTSGAAFTIVGNWSYSYRPLPWLTAFVVDSGTIFVRCSDIAFNVSLKLGKDEAGRPFIHSTKCQPSIKTVNINVNSNSDRPLVDLFYNVSLLLARENITKQAESLLCNVTIVVLREFNTQLSNMEVLSRVADNVTLDYRLVSTPEFRDGHITTKHKGESRSNLDSDGGIQFSPAPFPSQTSPSHMINIWVSDAVFNSLAFTEFIQGRFNTNITNVQVSGPNCHQTVMCLGTLFIQLKEDYPDSMGYVHLSATIPPVLRTSPNGSSLHMEGNISVNLCTQAADLHQVFMINVVLDMAIAFNLDGNVLKATTNTVGRAKMQSTDSDMGPIYPEDVEKLYDAFIREDLEQDLNEIGKIGMALPELPGLSLVNSLLTHFEGGLMFAADVESSLSRPPPLPRTTAYTPTTRYPNKEFVCRPPITKSNGASRYRKCPGCVMLIAIFILSFGKYV